MGLSLEPLSAHLSLALPLDLVLSEPVQATRSFVFLMGPVDTQNDTANNNRLTVEDDG